GILEFVDTVGIADVDPSIGCSRASSGRISASSSPIGRGSIMLIPAPCTPASYAFNMLTRRRLCVTRFLGGSQDNEDSRARRVGCRRIRRRSADARRGAPEHALRSYRAVSHLGRVSVRAALGGRSPLEEVAGSDAYGALLADAG